MTGVGRASDAGVQREPPGQPGRRPPQGVEIVLEVDDIAGQRAQVAEAGWPIKEDLTARPWGLCDFRILDPNGYYLRITDQNAG